jgi:predicted small metal-binding protein
MAITIKCADTGYDDTHNISGNSMSDVLSNMQKHAMDEHGLTEDFVRSEEQVEVWKGAIRQASRPSQTRTPRSME